MGCSAYRIKHSFDGFNVHAPEGFTVAGPFRTVADATTWVKDHTIRDPRESALFAEVKELGT